MNVCVLGLAAALLNNYYMFYASWGDVFGSTSPVQEIQSGAASAVTTHLPKGVTVPPASTELPPLPAPGQRWQTYTVTGPESHVTGTVLVQLPEGYDPSKPTRYPVIEALHGWPGGPEAVNHELSIDGEFRHLVDTHAIAAPIIVMPQINTPITLDTECVNAPPGKGLLTATWLGSDIPNWVAAHFRVSDERTSWAVMGASYGAWCASNIGMHYPAVFSASIGFMGYFKPEFSHSYRPFTGDPKAAETYDLVKLAHDNPPPISMWEMASKQDREAYAALIPFVQAAKAPLSVTADVLAEGGHNVKTIPPTLPRMVKWLVHAAPGFAPHSKTVTSPSPTLTASTGPLHVVALGDSVATSNACHCTPFPERAASALGAEQNRKVVVNNLAVGGATSSDVLTALGGASVQKVLGDADVVMLEIGANDFKESLADDADCVNVTSSACHGVPLEQLRTNLYAIVQDIKEDMHQPGSQVALIGYWNVFRDGAVGRNRGPTYVKASANLTDAVNAIVLSTAERSKTVYVDALQPFKGSGNVDPTFALSADGNHLNNVGQQLMADAVVDALNAKE